MAESKVLWTARYCAEPGHAVSDSNRQRHTMSENRGPLLRCSEANSVAAPGGNPELLLAVQRGHSDELPVVNALSPGQPGRFGT